VTYRVFLLFPALSLQLSGVIYNSVITIAYSEWYEVPSTFKMNSNIPFAFTAGVLHQTLRGEFQKTSVA
jgi:hypothetical protein